MLKYQFQVTRLSPVCAAAVEGTCWPLKEAGSDPGAHKNVMPCFVKGKNDAKIVRSLLIMECTLMCE